MVNKSSQSNLVWTNAYTYYTHDYMRLVSLRGIAERVVFTLLLAFLKPYFWPFTVVFLYVKINDLFVHGNHTIFEFENLALSQIPWGYEKLFEITWFCVVSYTTQASGQLFLCVQDAIVFVQNNECNTKTRKTEGTSRNTYMYL